MHRFVIEQKIPAKEVSDFCHPNWKSHPGERAWAEHAAGGAALSVTGAARLDD